MIYINGKLHEFSKADKDLVSEYTDEKGQVEIGWDDDQYRVNPTLARDKVGKYMTRQQLSDHPPSLPIQLQITSYDEKGNKIEVAYCESTSKDPANGQTIYHPRMKTMTNVLLTNDEELILFLVKYSPLISNNLCADHFRKKNSNHTFYLKLIQRVNEAEEMLKNEGLVDLAKGLIREKMKQDQLVDIALLMKIPGAATMQGALLRAKMLQEVSMDPQNVDPYHKYKNFLSKTKKLTKGDNHGIVVQRLIDAGKIKYSSQSHSWNEVDENGGTLTVIKKLRANQDSNAQNILVKLYGEDSDIQKKLNSLEKSLETADSTE